MAGSPRSYRSMEEFEREEIRPSYRIGFSLEDLVEESAFEGELNFEPDGEEGFHLDSVDDDDEDEEEEAADE